MPSAIEIKNLSHRFALRWALKNIDLKAFAGESVAVLGPNGCGKSTLLRILATRLTPTLGGGRILGSDLRKEAGGLRTETEWLGHDLGFYKTLLAEENLAFSSRLKGKKIARAKILEAMEAVGLNEHAQKFFGALSSGQKKRLALARILIENPSLILLDEPHTNLDKNGKVLMNGLIGRWKKEGKTIWMASHDHAEILSLCDQALILNEGKIIYFGEPNEVLTRFAGHL